MRNLARFRIPADKEVVFYCPEGQAISNDLGTCIESGEFWRVPYRRIVGPGQWCHEVMLSRLQPKYQVSATAIQPGGEVYLSTMLDKLPSGRIHLAACLYDSKICYKKFTPVGPAHPFGIVPVPQVPAVRGEGR